MKRRQRKPPGHAIPHPTTPPPAPTVLIVDDDAGLLSLISKVLESEGFIPATAASGTQAIAWLAQNNADLLLLDLKLRDFSGEKLIDAFQQSGHSIPFVIITGQGDERAAVQMMKRGALDYLVKDIKFIEFIPTVVRRALDQIEKVTERRRLEREILEISDRELQRIGQDLHDSLGQQLTAIELAVSCLADEVSTSLPSLVQSVREVSRHLRGAIRHTRALSHGLAGLAVYPDGIHSALLELADLTQSLSKIPCELICDPNIRIDDATIGTHLYRIAQEAVNNALKHSGSNAIRIALKQSARHLSLEVQDRGRGFSTATPPTEGMGLRMMRYRASLIGATLEILSTPAQGTRITCTL